MAKKKEKLPSWFNPFRDGPDPPRKPAEFVHDHFECLETKYDLELFTPFDLTKLPEGATILRITSVRPDQDEADVEFGRTVPTPNPRYAEEMAVYDKAVAENVERQKQWPELMVKYQEQLVLSATASLAASKKKLENLKRKEKT